MNKEDAKSPDIEKTWQAIDIFLFSNGQRYSPPRKYHLHAEDLNLWDCTLDYLARSHYGSLHTTIELYTLDGRKIEGPLELRDGTAYVAVVPQDAFIDSGYEKYLIKASKSWEKRQGKRTSIVEKDEPERTDCGHFQPCCSCPKKGLGYEDNATILGQKVASVLDHFLSPKSDCPTCAPDKNIPLGECGQCFCVCTAEPTTIKMPDENITKESAMVRSRRSSTPKLEKSETQPPLKSLAPPKFTNARNEKGRLSGQHTSFIKPVPSSNTQPRKLSAAKTKEGFHKKMLTKIPIKINENVNGLAGKPKRLTKTPQLLSTPQQLEPSAPLPTPSPPPLSQTPPPSSPPVTSLPPPITDAIQRTVSILNKTIPTDVTPTENFISNREIRVISADVYTNVESEITCFHMDSNRGSVIDKMISCYTIHNTVEKGVQAHIVQTTEKVTTADAGVSYSDSKIKVIPVTFTPDRNAISCNIPIEDNYIAVINKGDAVNLNLTIDLENSKTAQPNSYSNLDHRQARRDSSLASLANIFKKGNPQGSKDEETTVQNKSLQSIVSYVNDSSVKVVVVQCVCCGNNTAIPRIDTMPVYKDENGFFILIPGPPPGENQSCWPSPAQVIETTEVVVSKSEQPPCCTMEAHTQTEWCRVLLQVKSHDDGHYTLHLPSLEVLKYYSIQ